MNDKRILVVDDETDLLEMVKSIFTRAGFTQILTASSGEAALKMCEEQEPDMMILDVMMPGMDGFAALKELRKTSKIPVLMLTARGEAEDKFVGFENGADDYLLKPFLPKELLFRVQAILKRVYPEKERKVARRRKSERIGGEKRQVHPLLRIGCTKSCENYCCNISQQRFSPYRCQ
jgi:DNA-binding response OmpR family regulator